MIPNTYRTPRWAIWSALGVVAVLVMMWPEVLCKLITADGTIDDHRLVFGLRWLSALGVLALLFGLHFARQTPTPLDFVREMWSRRWRVLGGLVTVAVLGLLGTLMWAWYANRVPLADEAAVVRALQARRTDWPLQPIAVWLVDPAVAAAQHRLRRQGDLAAGVRPAVQWRPGQTLDWDNLTGPGVEFSLQRHDFVADLLASTDTAPSDDDLDWAAVLVGQWQAHHRPWPDWNPYVWNDDTTSNRIQLQMALIDLRRARKRTTADEELAFARSLKQHGERLAADEYFNAQTNHGLMQIDALLEIALRYPEFDEGGRWRQIALRRLKRYVAVNVTTDGVALELSPGYHRFITAKLMWTLALLKQVGDPYALDLESVVRRMVDQTVELIQPDGSLPGIGDTDQTPLKPGRAPWSMLPGSVGAGWLKHCQGLANLPGIRWSPGAGYVVLRAPAPRWTEADAMMAVFMLGPATRAHQHPDKLVVTLYAQGHAIFQGPGYVQMVDGERAQKIGTHYDTTLSVDAGSQRQGAVVDEWVVQLPEGATPGALAASGMSHLYAGVEHKRTLLYGVDVGRIAWVDEVRADRPRDLSVNFSLTNSVVATVTNDEVWLADGAQRQLCRLTVTMAGAKPRLRVDGRMVRASVRSDRAVLATEVECSPTAGPARTSRWTWQDEAVVWQGPLGSWRVPILAAGAGSRATWQRLK